MSGSSLLSERRLDERNRVSTHQLSDLDLLAVLDLGRSMARAVDGTILYWAQGCAELYGWTREEALGRKAHELLQTSFPCPLFAVEAMLESQGRWTGDLLQRAKNGTELVITAHKVFVRREGSPGIVLEVLTDVTQQRRSERELHRRELLLRTVAETTNGLLYAKDQHGRVILANNAFLSALGKTSVEVIGKTDREFLANSDQAEAVIVTDRAIVETGRPREVEETVDLPSGERRTFLSMKAPMRDDSGQVIGLVGFSADVTDRKRFERHLQNMIDELNHRVKNTLATVQAIALNLLVDADHAMFDALTDRLAALASVHDLLTQQSWAETGLRIIVENVIAPYDSASRCRFTLSGPTVKLRPKAAIALSIGLNELVTNAVKYGSLSTGNGHVDIQWHLNDASSRLHLDWREAGGPPVVTPERRGFGSRMIEEILVGDLLGSARLEFRPEGVVCSIDADAAAILSPQRPVTAGLNWREHV